MGDKSENPLDPDTAREFVDVVMAQGISGTSSCSVVDNVTQVTDLQCEDSVSEVPNIKDTRKRRNSDDEHDSSNIKHKHACESLVLGDDKISIPDCDVNINLTNLFRASLLR